MSTERTNTISPWHTLLICISSTFRDMQAERDHLRHHAFPRLCTAVEPRNAPDEEQWRRVHARISDFFETLPSPPKVITRAERTLQWIGAQRGLHSAIRPIPNPHAPRNSDP